MRQAILLLVVVGFGVQVLPARGDDIPTAIRSGVIRHNGPLKPDGSCDVINAPAKNITIDVTNGRVTYEWSTGDNPKAGVKRKQYELFFDNILDIQSGYSRIIPAVDFRKVGKRDVRVYSATIEREDDRVLKARKYLNDHFDLIRICAHPTAPFTTRPRDAVGVFNVKQTVVEGKGFIVRNGYTYNDFLANNLHGRTSIMVIEFKFDMDGVFQSFEVVKDSGSVAPFLATDVTIPLLKKTLEKNEAFQRFQKRYNLDNATSGKDVLAELLKEAQK